MKRKNPADNNAPEDEGTELHDCAEDEFPANDQIEEEQEVENEQGEEERGDCPSEPTAANDEAPGS